MEPLTKHARHVQVDHHHIFAKLSAPHDQFSARVKDGAAAVKDQFVLPADHVAKGDDGDIVGGAGSQHAFAGGTLFGVVG
jgi:hypothetical protein